MVTNISQFINNGAKNNIKVAAVSGPPQRQNDHAHSVDRAVNAEPRINFHGIGNTQKPGFMQARNAN
jgi:hypothetical protein